MTKTKRTAIVYCDDQFGQLDGKTAAGLLRRSETYLIVGVIDRTLGGRDSGYILSGQPNGIPIFRDLEAALSELDQVPECYIYGKAPLETTIPKRERQLLIQAMSRGMDIVSGLHQFFSEDSEMIDTAAMSETEIFDIRKPPALDKLHTFTGQISNLNVPVVAVLGTDCACGKMTTAVELNTALHRIGVNSVLVATGQTCIMQGAQHGISIDALVSQFVVGEIEHAILATCEHETPDIILVEGQSSVSHPAFMGAVGILKGSCPDAVILQHPPARKFRCDFPDIEMPLVEDEIFAIESISQTKVIALSLSHEGIDDEELQAVICDFEKQHGLPTTDVLKFGTDKIVRALINEFPSLAIFPPDGPRCVSQTSAVTVEEKGLAIDLVTTAHRNLPVDGSAELPPAV
ncbi:MAG: DUF1611 domain-containing protein [Aureliella sp.]